ncbi:MAG: hypothetical protein HYV29_06295 [Ignavibacteriales bacterium]|nr:hypothetical protein [Ignavibacteriales bacterium]
MIDQRWHKAAILGSVWASIEIVFGSFLHNIKFPLTGTILSAVGISLLVAGHSLWREKGIVWRAGIICAVMKSVSPSSVILGPMVGITVEALIVEAAIRMLGGNGVGYIIGGAVACITPLIQKTISYLFVYGMNIVTMFEKLVEYASKVLQMPSLHSFDVVIAVVGLNFVFGGLASSLGLVVGRRARFHCEQKSVRETAQSQSDNLKQSDFQFSFLFFLLHLGILVSGLLIQSIVFLLYVPFCIYRYPAIRKRFRKVSFWVEIGAVSLLAGLILGEFTLSNRTEGIFIGMQMFFRAIFVVSIFSSINIEIRNPLIVNFLFRKQLKSFSAALDTAFAALPDIIDSLQREKLFFRHPIDSLARVLSHAGEMVQPQTAQSKVYVLTGAKDGGKTKMAEQLQSQLKINNFTVGGIIQRKVLKNNERYGYDLYDVRSQKSTPLCRTDAPDAGIVAGPFKFFPEGIRFGKEALAIAKIKNCNVIIIDEIGPLEMKGEGWAVALSEILANYSGILIVVIREFLVDEMVGIFQFTPTRIWHLSEVEIADILQHIRLTVKEQ